MSTYVLNIKISTDTDTVVGRRGTVRLNKGLYLYVGSARKGLRQRVQRHLGTHKKLHWHIDYILDIPAAEIMSVWVSAAERECLTAEKLTRLGGMRVVAEKIGSSDCGCRTHFFGFRGRGSAVTAALKQQGFMKWKDP